MFGTVVFTSCSNSQTSETASTSETKRTTQNSQNDKIDFENAFIVDVRTPQEFKAGHFEGAINIPLNTVESNVEKFQGHDQVVVYCRSGARSGQAKNMLMNAGVDNIINGINEAHLNKIKKQQ
ncbi:sulfurtransferase [Brumimicrobium oceani]|uniref:Sulfurtransferase n=2 Tax=Brumimicrobium oceani TaxID=2100725 RepID=A0A2U2X3A9_9FLAO|nr:sulfurtransferase [Brumimicrobium oceani]